ADFSFELMLSSAAFGQLKRHRISTQITGPYDVSLSWTTPESIEEAGMKEVFDEVLQRSAQFANRIADSGLNMKPVAPYALCNAHRRRVIFKANARELYHISRLREDIHSQWDIRNLATQMLQIASEKMPSLFVMATGKHHFADRRQRVFKEDVKETPS
ncbi:MAG TPA: FAD-dependent thymidylate synthase, partial [Bacteroidetes bacterium]|nr:FAD-dependent thymidylate synthase [Bacteroidota bacterium]HEX04263.1 FAD-dependent thymidylate synthase [Bacteroidota bacterium]